MAALRYSIPDTSAPGLLNFSAKISISGDSNALLYVIYFIAL